jgi:hypothetical protein
VPVPPLLQRHSKNFYFNQSLEFNAANEDYADLTNFKLTDTASVTVTLKAFDFSGKQVILSQNDAGGNPFMLCLNSGVLELMMNGTTESLGSLRYGLPSRGAYDDPDGSSVLVKVYLDGTLLSQKTFSAYRLGPERGHLETGCPC